ncbi:DeoR family transcriptional regulator, partial [Streptomyces sp. NPDC059956]
MDTEERRREILRLVRRTGSVEVATLATDFQVAKETIRRDLHVF